MEDINYTPETQERFSTHIVGEVRFNPPLQEFIPVKKKKRPQRRAIAQIIHCFNSEDNNKYIDTVLVVENQFLRFNYDEEHPSSCWKTDLFNPNEERILININDTEFKQCDGIKNFNIEEIRKSYEDQSYEIKGIKIRRSFIYTRKPKHRKKKYYGMDEETYAAWILNDMKVHPEKYAESVKKEMVGLEKFDHFLIKG